MAALDANPAAHSARDVAAALGTQKDSTRSCARAARPLIRKLRMRLAVLGVLTLLACALYLTLGVNFAKPHLAQYALSLRIPKLVAMLVVALGIGAATLVFQSIIRNKIVTPCLLGMNSLYSLVHTAIYFFAGSASVLVLNENLSFAVDLVVMGVAAVVIYGWLFKKTRYNVLYVLLIGTVLTSLFGSMQNTLVRVMDPNEYETLLNELVASFSSINVSIIIFSFAAIAAVGLLLHRQLALTNVITLGKHQAINLGVDYDRTIRALLLGVTICIAVATALVGPISFLGLIIANLGRQLLPTYRHSYLIAGSALFGMVALVSGQLISERLFHLAVPVSTFITIAGGVYFLLLLLRERRA